MFAIPQINQVVVQLALLGIDEVAIAKVFDELVKDTSATAFDCLGTDGHRVRSMRYESAMTRGGQIVAINLTSVASPERKFRRKPISTGTQPALDLAVMGLDATIVFGDWEHFRSTISHRPVVTLSRSDLANLHAAVAEAADAAFGSA